MLVLRRVEQSEGGGGEEKSGALSGGEVEEEQDLGGCGYLERELGDDGVGEGVGGAEGFELGEGRDVVLSLGVEAACKKERVS